MPVNNVNYGEDGFLSIISHRESHLAARLKTLLAGGRHGYATTSDLQLSLRCATFQGLLRALTLSGPCED
jgi:hypothetical protein